MRRLMFLLSLIAVLAATPLRLAEAAEDLARSLAEFGNAVNLEEVDGGVGDDSGATIKTDVVRCPSAFASSDFLSALHHVAVPCADCVAVSSAISWANPPGGSARRCAWLQRFRC